MSHQTTSALPSSESISSLPLFTDMDDDLLRGLIASTRIMEDSKGALVLGQGQPVTRFYIILKGWCGISKGNQDGQESILQIMARGDLFPDPELSLGDVITYNVQALTQIKLAMLPPTIVRNALHYSQAFMKNMFAASVRRNQELRDHIEQLTLRSAEERVGRFLLQMRLMTQASLREVELPFDKTLIASYLGIKPETFSRALQLFKDNGYEIKRNHILAPDFEALCAFCDSTAANVCHHKHTERCQNPLYGAGEG